MRKDFIMNYFIKIIKKINDNLNIDFIKFIFKLINKYFELNEILIDFLLNLLINTFNISKNVDYIINN